jgi:hypothetical protein
MTPFDERFGRILDLAESIQAHREKFIGRAVKDIQFTYPEIARDTEIPPSSLTAPGRTAYDWQY